MEKTKDIVTLNFSNADVRMLNIGGEPWWVLRDVCDILGIKDPSDVAERLEDDEKRQFVIKTDGGARTAYIVNESGLYNAIFRSDKPEAQSFRRWITHEVIPQIRQFGFYVSNDLDALKRLVLRSVNERYKRAAIIDAIRISDVSIPRFVSELVSNPDIMDVRRLTSADKREDVYRPEHRQIFTLIDMVRTYPHDIAEVEVDGDIAYLLMNAQKYGKKKRSKQVARTFNDFYISMDGMIEIANDMVTGRFPDPYRISEATRDVWIENIRAYCEPWIAECEALPKPDYFQHGYDHVNMERTTVELKKLAEASREAIEAGKDNNQDLTVKG